ncbi:MAG: hypothetical protein IPG38_02680 [Chitinophagaceae bacterium]|nr:hypothetical protein [Chitinophagaceae bacterium]
MTLLEDQHVYKRAMEIGELVFQVTEKWDIFNKKTFRRPIPQGSRFNIT